MIRLLLDQGLPLSTATLLRSAGWDVVHLAERDLSRAADTEVLEVAHREGRICVTADADFHAILAVRGATGPTVIRLRREGLSAETVAKLLRDIWPRIEEAALSGALITVTAHDIRLRALPIGEGE